MTALQSESFWSKSKFSDIRISGELFQETAKKLWNNPSHVTSQDKQQEFETDRNCAAKQFRDTLQAEQQATIAPESLFRTPLRNDYSFTAFIMIIVVVVVVVFVFNQCCDWWIQCEFYCERLTGRPVICSHLQSDTAATISASCND